VRLGGGNYVTGRAEVADKEDLDARIKALTVGYTRDITKMAAVGGNVTVYAVPESLKGAYGSPRSLYLFVRLRR